MDGVGTANRLRFRATSLPGGFDAAVTFNLMQVAFDQALRTNSTRVSQRLGVFAGQPAQVRIIGERLAAQTLPAISHLVRNENGAPNGLKIDLWDASETAVPCPINALGIQQPDFPAWRKGQYGFTIGAPNERFVGRRRFRMLMWMDRQTQHVIGCANDSEKFSALERANPVRFSLFLWHSDQGAPVIHAALVSKNGSGILLGGKGGVGKTTTALASLYSGFDYLGDDYIGLQAAHDRSFVGHSLYNSAWLPQENLSRFPALIAYAERGEYAGRERYLVFLHSIFPGQFATSAPIRAVVLPRVASPSLSRVHPATKGEALLALAPTSIINLPNSGSAALAHLARLIERVPCYWLDLGSDLEAIARRLEEVIS